MGCASTDTKAGEGQGAWLAELLAALLVRAAEVDPATAPQPAPSAWTAAWTAFFPLLARHLQTLQVGASFFLQFKGADPCVCVCVWFLHPADHVDLLTTSAPRS